MSWTVLGIPSCETGPLSALQTLQEKNTAQQIVRRLQSPGDHRVLHHLALYAFCDDHQCSFMSLLDPQSDLERILTENGRRWTVGGAKTIEGAVCHTRQHFTTEAVSQHGDLKANHINITPTGPVLLDFLD